eukprot:2779676-Ditylum_brightwellii.AAC.1
MEGLALLQNVCISGTSVEVVCRLLEVCPNVARETSSLGYKPLHYAIHSNASLDVIEILLEVYPDAVKIKNKFDQDTPLHYACRQGNIALEVVSALLDV